MQSFRELKFRAIHLIRTRHTDPTLDAVSVAQALHVSRRHLDRAFREGQSVSEVITAFRVTTALDLLGSARVRNLETLTRLSGFTDRNTFRANFVRLCGITPSRARELAIEATNEDLLEVSVGGSQSHSHEALSRWAMLR